MFIAVKNCIPIQVSMGTINVGKMQTLSGGQIVYGSQSHGLVLGLHDGEDVIAAKYATACG